MFANNSLRIYTLCAWVFFPTITHLLPYVRTHSLTRALTHSPTHSLTHSLTLSTSLSRLGHKPSINPLHSTLSLVLAYASAHVRPSSSSFFITVLLRVFCGRRSSSQLESIWWQLWVSCHWAFVGYDQAIAACGFELYFLRNSCLQNFANVLFRSEAWQLNLLELVLEFCLTLIFTRAILTVQPLV